MRSRRRATTLAWAAVAAVTIAAAAAGAGPAVARRTANPCHQRRLRLLCPELVMLPPSHLELDQSTLPGHTLLRAASGIENVGAGPLEVRGRRIGSTTMSVAQAIRDVRGHWHRFSTRGRLDYTFVPGSRYGEGNVGDASYWKLRHAAAFQLWSLGPRRHAMRLVRRGPKLDYCLRDLVHTHPSRHSPRGAVFPGCNQDPSARQDRLGTSAGWTDEYPYGYPQQWIDVTGLSGRFAFVQIADPGRILFEANENDNVSEVYISLPSGAILGRRTGVYRP